MAESGEIECWGANDDGQATPPAGRYQQVSARGDSTCAVKQSGEIECWGNNFYGQATVPAGRYQQVSAGDSHVCAVKQSGDVECWPWPRVTLPADTQTQSNDEDANSANGRIVVRRLHDGRTEFAWHVEGGERVLPRQRYLPANPPTGRWLNSSDIVVEGVNVGRINVRVDAETGRVEFAFTPTGRDRILPRSRYFPSNAETDVWLRSTLIEPGG